VHITYNEEIMWGSGVGLSNGDPRTAVGYTSDNQVILMVADGRQTISEGVSLTELAEIMISVGCIAALNLDGGGSTQMTIGGAYVNSPSEIRSIPALLAIVHRDSCALPIQDSIETVIDTGDDFCELLGGGWFPTANSGYWGLTPAMLNTIGDGSCQAVFHTQLSAATECRIYAWWVAANNRCKNTPVVIIHSAGRDTVRVDQTAAHAQWNYIGTYTFDDQPDQAVIISNAGTVGTYVVADAIRLVSADSLQINTTVEQATSRSEIRHFSLAQNYPNPFNPSTTIRFTLNYPGVVTLKIVNLAGQCIATPLADRPHVAGVYEYIFAPDEWSSGIYFCQLSCNGLSVTRKMILLR